MGISLLLKEGKHPHRVEELLTGKLHRKGESIKIKLIVKWTKGPSLGGEFVGDKVMDRVRDFLSPQNIVKSIYPLHLASLGLKLPSRLKYWLKGDGPTEFFIWCHSDGSISSFQMIFGDKIIEWEDGLGTKTGRILTHEDVETPLQDEKEFLFQIDSKPDSQLIHLAGDILSQLPNSQLPSEEREFLSLRLPRNQKWGKN